MSSLNLFPARVPTGWFRGPDGKNVDVFATPEFFRALSAVFDRIGGSNGIANDELALFTILAPVATISAPEIADLEVHGAEQGAQLLGLQRALEEIQMLANAVSSLSVEVQALRQGQDAVAMIAGYQDQFRVNWERPGTIGSATPNTGAFTTLSATAAVTLNPANANVNIKPSGTGIVDIQPATVGALNRMNIGAVVEGTGAFTTLTASAAATFSPANAAVTMSPTGTGVVTINPATVGALNNMNIGASTPKTGAFTTLSSTGVATLNGVTVGGGTSNFYADVGNAAIRPTGSGAGAGIYFQNSAGAATWAVVTVAGVQVTSGFGCNGTTPQTAVASGAVLSAYGAGANGLAVAADMKALVDKVIAIDAACKANGILS